VVAGEDPSPLQRLMATTDSANGIASRLDFTRWLFLNTDLTVHLHRKPAGEWIAVDAETAIGPEGAGVCSGVLHDRSGPMGRSSQILTVRPR
jgi:acyl-CoA thioesterase